MVRHSFSSAKGCITHCDPVGTTVAAIIVLIVCSGSQRVSAKDAFTLFENNTGWSNSELPLLAFFFLHLTMRRWLGVSHSFYFADVDANWV
jgi:hypothetical protein